VLGATGKDGVRMQSRSVRIAYLKRMFKKLDAEADRVSAQALAGYLTTEEESFALELLEQERQRVEIELKQLNDTTA